VLDGEVICIKEVKIKETAAAVSNHAKNLQNLVSHMFCASFICYMQ